MKRKAVIDARGVAGTRGTDGAGYSSGQSKYGSGSDGADGKPGTPGGPGGPGGVIEVELSWRDRPQLLGTCNGEPVILTWKPGETEEVLLTARGGPGGPGGDGGRGQDGARGSSGSNATRYSSGGNGGDGGDGGDGGSSGSGGKAGPGGKVQLRVSLEDSDLLLPLLWDVRSGEGGRAGRAGAGGGGGSGGSGGSSYSWTESETYTDSQGKTQTRTRFRSNPGGSDGSPGRSGMSGRAGRDGEANSDGRFLLEVEGRPCSDRYRLDCGEYLVLSGDGNTVLEFGEKDNRVSGLTVFNRGQSPTPPLHVKARLEGEFPFLSRGDSRHIPPVPPGRSYVVPDLFFDLAEAPEGSLPCLHKALQLEMNLWPRAHFERVQMDDPEFHRRRTMWVTFPVELRTVLTTTSIATGSRVRQDWVVENRSDRPFPPPHRELLVDLSLSDNEAGLQVSDEEGRPLELGPEPALFRKLDPIPPGRLVTLATFIQASNTARPYSHGVLTASLRLTPQGGGEPRTIQSNPVSYGVAVTHRNRPADVLLVTHHGCGAEEIENWTALLDELGLSWNIWDISLNGGLFLADIADTYRGKLAVLLNSPFQTPDRCQVMPTDFLSYHELRERIASDGWSVYVLGEGTHLLDHLVPQPREYRTFTSVTDYLKRRPENGDGVNPEVPRDMNRSLDKIAISKFFLAGQPNISHISRQGISLLKKLKKKFPQKRFHVTCLYDPDDNLGWLRNRRCGVLEVRAMPDRDARAVITRSVYRETAQTRDFLFSAENLLGLFSAQDFDDKLAFLNSARECPPQVWEALADAFLMDLLEEQVDLRSVDVRLGKRKMKEALNRTVDFCTSDFRGGQSHLDPDSDRGGVLVRVAAGLEFISRNQMAWWDHRVRFLGGTTDVEISNLVRELVDDLLDGNFGPDRIWGAGAPRKRVEQLVQEREAALEAERSRLLEQSQGALTAKTSAVESLVRWELRDYLSSDALGESILVDQEALGNLQTAEQKHDARRLELELLYSRANRSQEGQ